jgi:Bacteriophage head to tail connecting protein
MDTSEGLGTLGAPNTMLEMLRKRYNAAKYVADLWIPIMQACFFYAVPFRNRYYLPGKEFQGTIQNTRVYDTTAVEGVKTFVSKLHDTMTPPQVQWGFLEVDSNMVKDEEDETSLQMLETAQLELDRYMRQLFTYIHASNFDVVINECYYDLSIGTAALVINQYNDDQPFLCTSIPMDKLAISEAVNGKIESWFRTWQNLKICELNTRWPRIQLTSNLIQLIASDPDAVVKMVYEGVAYFPNMPGGKNYLYAVWDGEDVLYSEWLKSNPGVIWRFQKTNNETWGRGAVMEALPSIISLNELARLELASANLNIFRPYMGFSDAVFNPHTFRLEPFAIIPIAPIGSGGQVPLIPLPGSYDIQIGQFTMEDLRKQIKALLYAETPEDSGSVQPQTAYELSLKQQNLAQKIGPLFSRLQQEFLEPVIARFAYILNSMGKLPYPKVGDIPIIFKYKSPLALAKGQQDIARFTQFVQLMQGIMGPDVTQLYINPKTTPYLLSQSLQIDPRFLNKPDDVAKVMQRVQDEHSQQKMLAQSQGMMPEQPENPASTPIAPPQ